MRFSNYILLFYSTHSEQAKTDTMKTHTLIHTSNSVHKAVKIESCDTWDMCFHDIRYGHQRWLGTASC